MDEAASSGAHPSHRRRMERAEAEEASASGRKRISMDSSWGHGVGVGGRE